MLINKVIIKNFRNIETLNLDTSFRRVILRAENGQGKTNLLEALYLLCYGSSFRTNNLKDCINYNSSSFYLKSNYNDSLSFERNTEVFVGKQINSENDIISEVDKNRNNVKTEQNNLKHNNSSKLFKSIKIDSKEIKDRSELIYNIPCIVFSHNDLEIVRGEPENRRRFFDQTMTMYDSVYFDYQRRYRQVLKQRNASLKEEKYELLDIYDMKLANYGLYLIREREKVCRSFSEIFTDLYGKVSLDNKRVIIEYKPSWIKELSEDEIIGKLYNQREVDIKMKSTTTGPHRDKFIFTDENGFFINSASTGQMRLASVVLRTAQAAFFRLKSGKNPIFLIDDVLLEMDSEKRARYLSILGDYDQAFFTFLPDENYYDEFFNINDKDTVIYDVKKGKFTKASKFNE